MARSRQHQTSPAAYEQLWEFESGFDQVRRALRRLAEHRAFQATKIERFAALVEEARAATASYLTGALEDIETQEAGRLFRLRKTREARED